VYYLFSFGTEVDKVFLSISTFLFSIFTGFFISRQASRFNKVRETVTKFDGIMSGIYRSSGHIAKKLQTAIGKVIVSHYDHIFETGKWNIHFLEKSTTLTDIHKLLDKHVVDEDIVKLPNQALGAVVKSLVGAQDVRKQMVALHEERIPAEQWILIWFFATILVGTVSTMTSVGELFPSILKAAFVISIFSVLLILYRLNNLVFTEKIMGQHSAEDVVGIIEGKK
tara:strand:- start:9 stop:683 length:675 start_codon:yes stop_codon:yes gene_type:complete